MAKRNLALAAHIKKIRKAKIAKNLQDEKDDIIAGYLGQDEYNRRHKDDPQIRTASEKKELVRLNLAIAAHNKKLRLLRIKNKKLAKIKKIRLEKARKIRLEKARRLRNQKAKLKPKKKVKTQKKKVKTKKSKSYTDIFKQLFN